MNDIIYFANQNVLLTTAWLTVVFALLALEIKIRFFGPLKLSPTDLISLLNSDNASLYDIRPTTEYSKGHISKAKNFQFTELNNHKVLLSKADNKTIILVCKDGIKSSQEAFKLLNSAGKNKYANKVAFLYGGMSSWQAENLPIVN